MKKKPVNWLSYLPIITLGVGLLAGGIRFQLQAENTKTEVKELKIDTKTKIEKVEADIKEIAKEGDEEIKDLKDKDSKLEKAVEVNQVKQEEINKKVGEIKQTTDKIVGLLLEMQQKKK